MDKIWDRNSFEVGGHWPSGRYSFVLFTVEVAERCDSLTLLRVVFRSENQSFYPY